MTPLYSGTWSSREEVESDFRITLPPHHEILVAHYSGYGTDESDYEMWARVLFVDRSVTPNQLYEVHGSHCSCYGLEDQWSPEPVTIQDVLSDLRMGRTWEHASARVLEALTALLRK